MGGTVQDCSIFSWRSSWVCGSILLYCFSKNYLCGFRVCFHSGWDGKGSDLSATLLSPKVYATGGKLGFCIFPFSLGCSLIPCESAFSWAGPSQTLQALALLDKEQLFGLGGSDHAPSCWYVDLLFSGPMVAFNSDILRSGLADLCLSHWIAFHFTSTASLPQALSPGFPWMAGHPEVAPQGYTRGQRWGQVHYVSHRRYVTEYQGIPNGPLLLCLTKPATALASWFSYLSK